MILNSCNAFNPAAYLGHTVECGMTKQPFVVDLQEMQLVAY
jgi:hypothetical protein